MARRRATASSTEECVWPTLPLSMAILGTGMARGVVATETTTDRAARTADDNYAMELRAAAQGDWREGMEAIYIALILFTRQSIRLLFNGVGR